MAKRKTKPVKEIRYGGILTAEGPSESLKNAIAEHKESIEPEKPTSKWPPLPEKLSICIYRFPYGFQEHSTTVQWLMNALFVMSQHPRIEKVFTECINDTPVDMSRNRAIRHALDNKVDFAVFLDSDMFPDYQLGQKGCPEGVVAFLPNALEFALQHDGPCCVGAPYCCQPPEENVLIMRWRNQETDDPDMAMKLDKYTREEATERRGYEEVAALPTGLLLIDLRAVQVKQAPWFSYQFKTPENTHKASTEDVVFTRDLSLAGVPQYVLWDAWAGHWKMKLVCKPVGIDIKVIPDAMRKSVELNMAKRFEKDPEGTLKEAYKR